MKAFKKTVVIVAALLAVVLAGVLLFATTKPDVFRVERAESIKAPPEKIFAVLNDYHNWQAWSPYEKRDPAMQRSFSGAARGMGAVYAWRGNKDVGAGRMEIIDAAAPSHLVMSLDFIEPFEAHNKAEFSLQPQGGTTRVSWAMYGPMPYVSKVMSVFFDMDQMIGRDFETGLATLKTVAEK